MSDMSDRNEIKSESALHDLLDRVRRLEQAVFGAARSKAKRANLVEGERPRSKDIDFSMPIRAFVKKHALGMSGPKKFTLLIAYLSKGDSRERVALVDVKKQWNKMSAKSLLAMKFNGFYTSQARAHIF
jgi:hypothetical protein